MEPFITVIVPIRNEADFVESCLGSILASGYPPERLEVLVIDGMSDDGTREIVGRIASQDRRVRLVDNPDKIVSCAMNKGIREAQGEIIIRIDGHATVDHDFILRSVCSLEKHPEAWCVGGPVESVNSTLVGKTIAAAMSSPVGVGNAMFRIGNYEGYVDTVAFGAYWRWVFDKIGLFDEDLIRNQDDELNMRLLQAGGKIYMTPAIQSQYYPRASFKKLAKQYYQYGYWRIRTIQKHGQPATLRQVVPLAFITGWLLLLGASLVSSIFGVGLAGLAVTYILALLVGALWKSPTHGWRVALVMPVVFCILHFAYGIGSLVGVFCWILLQRKVQSDKAKYGISR